MMAFDASSLAQLSSALLTPTIAVITTYVAVQQYRMARAKKELELYDRRLAIYRNVQHIIYFVERGNTVSQDKYAKWLDSIAEAEFLFGPEVTVMLNQLADEVGDHMSVSDPELGTQDSDEMARVTLRIGSLYGVSKEVFAPYLNLRHIAGYRGRALSTRKVASLLKPITEEKKKDEARARSTGANSGLDEDVPF